jgi:hypothetical protein
MSKLEALVDAVCGTGVLLAPIYLFYKFAAFVAS